MGGMMRKSKVTVTVGHCPTAPDTIFVFTNQEHNSTNHINSINCVTVLPLDNFIQGFQGFLQCLFSSDNTGKLYMGLRQSVAQSTDEVSTSTGNHGQAILASGNEHASTSSSAVGGARPRHHAGHSASSAGHRSRQVRSRSMTTSSPQLQADVAALLTAITQQRRRANRLLLGSTTGRELSDQSSDSDDDNDAMTASTIRSLDRLLRLNSITGDSSDAHSSSSAQRIWVPPVAFRCFDVKCPVCNKSVPSDDAELHLVVCLTRPKIVYNEEVLPEDRDECVICFEEMSQGDTIARLPCLCVYHKTCIDGWFKVKNCCPAHPTDD